MTTVESKVIGVMHQFRLPFQSFDDWVSDVIEIPYLNNKSLISFINCDPEVDPNFIQDADKALKFFLGKINDDRLRETTLFVYQNCIDSFGYKFNWEKREYQSFKGILNASDI